MSHKLQVDGSVLSLRARKKESMNFERQAEVEARNVNVVSLFGTTPVIEDKSMIDPLETLLEEAALADEIVTRSEVVARKIVNENQFPDQSMYVLDEQLKNLKTSLSRLKYYIGELDDLLPS